MSKYKSDFLNHIDERGFIYQISDADKLDKIFVSMDHNKVSNCEVCQNDMFAVRFYKLKNLPMLLNPLFQLDPF